MKKKKTNTTKILISAWHFDVLNIRSYNTDKHEIKREKINHSHKQTKKQRLNQANTKPDVSNVNSKRSFAKNMISILSIRNNYRT